MTEQHRFNYPKGILAGVLLAEVVAVAGLDD